MAYEKNRPVQIGTPGLPFPTMKRMEKTVGGKPVTTYELGVIESYDEPLTLWTARESDAEVIGHLYRNLPTRGMLPAFEALIAHGQRGQDNKITSILSDPGPGKTHMCRTFGELRDPRGPIMASASKDTSLESWLFETVFDAEKKGGFIQEVDKGLANGTLSPLTIKTLREFGKHFSVQDGRKSLDWKGLSEDATIKHEDIEHIVSSVRKIEGWDSQSTGIGFSIKKGPLVRAELENRDFLGDEYNRAEPGTESALQIVTQVKNGETAQHEVSLGGNGTHTFKRGTDTLLMLTGNYPKDGGGAHEMSDSFKSRVHEIHMPQFAEADWQDRTTQILSGFPITYMHKMARGKMEGKKGAEKWVVDKPEDFRDFLLNLSTLGMSDAQKLNVKDWQLSFASNWQNTLEAGERLGTFYHKWSQLTDRDSQLYKSGNLSNILLEVDNADIPTETITPRRVIEHIGMAQMPAPQKKTLEASAGFDLKRNWNIPLKARIGEKEPVVAHFGDRLVAIILDDLERSTVGKPNLRAQLMEDAKEAGLTGKNPAIAKLLNVDITVDKAAEANHVQRLHAALLRNLYPDLKLSSNDEDVLPIRQVQAQLAVMAAAGETKLDSPYITVLHVPNTDPAKAQAKLFTQVAADSQEADEPLSAAKKRLPPKSLTGFRTLLTSLAMPVVGANNVKSLWNTSLTGGRFAADDATAMAEGTSASGIAITTLLCKKDGTSIAEYAPLHALQNKKTGRTILIGDEAVSDQMYDQLKRNHITYINRQNPDSRTWIRSEIRATVEPQYEETVQKAFLMRNKLSSQSSESIISLARLLSDATQSAPERPNFITSLEPDKITHTQRINEASKKRVLGNLL